jgi:hypothetical protein
MYHLTYCKGRERLVTNSWVKCQILAVTSYSKHVLASCGDSRVFQSPEQCGDRQPDKLIKPVAHVRPWFSKHTDRRFVLQPNMRPKSTLIGLPIVLIASFHRLGNQKEQRTWLKVEGTNVVDTSLLLVLVLPAYTRSGHLLSLVGPSGHWQDSAARKIM